MTTGEQKTYWAVAEQPAGSPAFRDLALPGGERLRIMSKRFHEEALAEADKALRDLRTRKRRDERS